MKLYTAETTGIMHTATAATKKSFQTPGFRLNLPKALKTDLLTRLEKLEAWHRELAEITAEYPELAKQRILNRLADEKLPVSADDPALMREVLFYVDKGDVTEERPQYGFFGTGNFPGNHDIGQ